MDVEQSDRFNLETRKFPRNKDKVHYRIPLKLFNSGDWASLTPPARAILPVIGVYASETGRAWPGIKLISKGSGYKDHHSIQKGMRSLIKTGLLEKEKVGRRNEYYLKGNAIWLGHSSFPIYKDVIEGGHWAGLLPCEKAVFPLLATKASIKNPEVEDMGDPLVHSIGRFQPAKWIRLSGVTRPSFYKGIYGLVNKGWINFYEENQYIVYLKRV